MWRVDLPAPGPGLHVHVLCRRHGWQRGAIAQSTILEQVSQTGTNNRILYTRGDRAAFS
jgi:hypothetical protein